MARFALVVSFFLLTVPSSFSQVTRDPSALTVVQNALAALGGVSALGQVTDATVQGTSQRPNVAGTFTWETAGSEFRYQSQTARGSRLFVSGHGSPAQLEDGNSPPIGPHVLRSTLPFHVPGLALLAEFNNPNYSITYVGPETLNGTSVVHIHTVDGSDDTGQTLTPQDWYFDPVTWLPVEVACRVPDPVDASSYQPTTLDFSNPTQVSGVIVPFTVVMTVLTTPTTFSVSSVAFSSGVSSSDFQLPGGGGQ